MKVRKHTPLFKKFFIIFGEVLDMTKAASVHALAQCHRILRILSLVYRLDMWFGLITGILTREHNLCSVSEAVLNKVVFCTKDLGYQTHNRERQNLPLLLLHKLFFLVGGGGWEPRPVAQCKFQFTDSLYSMLPYKGSIFPS
jgi:hypothetical protein